MTTDKPKTVIDPERCTGCGECVNDCPRSVLALDKNKKAVPVKPELCIQCGHCVAVCPEDAVTLPAYDPDNFPSLQAEPLVCYDELLPFLRRRRSVRRYKKKAVPREIIDQLIEVARYAPTGSNLQGCEYIIIDGFEPVRRVAGAMIDYYTGLAKMMETPWGKGIVRITAGSQGYAGLKRYLPAIRESAQRFEAGDDPVFYSAPLLIGIHTGAGAFTAHDDCIIAMYHMIMAAETLGLGSCINGFLTNSAHRSKGILNAMEIPDGHRLYAAATFGFPAVCYHRTVDRFQPNENWIER